MVRRALLGRLVSFFVFASLAGGAIGGSAAFVLSSQNVTVAEAHDYTPVRYCSDPDGNGPLIANYCTAMSNIAWYSQGTVITQDAVDAWNWWLGSQYGTPAQFYANTGCPLSGACILFVNDGTQINGTSCTVPENNDDDGGPGPNIPDIWASTWAATPGIQNLPGSACSFGTLSAPVFVVAVDDEQPGGFSTVQRQHIGRHEVGHAIQLNHASFCRNDTHPFAGTWQYPIMTGGQSASCSAFNSTPPDTVYTNEMLYVIGYNGW